ncbi:conserved hypothetical protein, secreted [Candidatus Magnetomorum sp. HK-1]|nr:conserved hypothetical protein, secreted [Candidatus Magnetomorum sp. HK-1]
MKFYISVTLTIFIFIFYCVACNSVDQSSPKIKNGRVYGEIPHFKHQWYHYYARGLSFAEGHFFSDACSDLQTAIHKRTKDQRNARTYGFHYMDYFPHRELGIIYYRQKKIKLAINQLKLSLSSEKSARAEFYLDLARKDLIQSDKLDHHPPNIVITSPKHTDFRNTPDLTIQGYVTDDTFVKKIDIEKRPVRMDLSQKKKTFTMNFSLKPGQNEILIQAEDISGKISHVSLNITLDRIPPLIAVDQLFEKEALNKIVISANIFDSNGLERFVIDEYAQNANGLQQIKISKTLPLKPNQKQIHIQVYDKAGNCTQAFIPIKDHTKAIFSNQLLAGDFMTDDSRKSILLSQQSTDNIGNRDSIFPVINLRFPREKKVTFLDFMYLEGSVQDNDEVSHLSVNGKNLLPFAGKKIFFNHIIPLKKGKNVINLSAMDPSGNSTGRTLKVTRQVPGVEQHEARLKIAIANFERDISATILSKCKNFENLLYIEMKKKQRFTLIHPEKLNVKKRRINDQEKEKIDEKSALLTAKTLHADYVMFGKITENQDNMTIYIRLVDTELPDTIEDIAVGVYTENVDRDQLFVLAQGLNFKLADELPLLKGLITRIMGDEILVDIGRKDNIKKGMKLIIYHIEKIKDPKTDIVIWEKFSNNGQARIESPQEAFSMAKLMKNKGLSDQKTQQQIITK